MFRRLLFLVASVVFLAGCSGSQNPNSDIEDFAEYLNDNFETSNVIPTPPDYRYLTNKSSTSYGAKERAGIERFLTESEAMEIMAQQRKSSDVWREPIVTRTVMSVYLFEEKSHVQRAMRDMRSSFVYVDPPECVEKGYWLFCPGEWSAERVKRVIEDF